MKRQSFDNRALALYCHIPYCIQKCPYCDFHSVPIQGALPPSGQYGLLLERQLAEEVRRLGLAGRRLVSVFFGGGTPSLMPPSFYHSLLREIARHFSVAADLEITVEMNPATADRGKLTAYREAGVNRLSVGIQSFQPHLLKSLGRNHSGEEAVAAIQVARQAGFSRLSADLILGVEGETMDDLRDDLRCAAALDPGHLSVYALTVEPQTPLAHWVAEGRYHLPEEEVAAAMLELVPEFLISRGLRQYEISNFARPEDECRHNLHVWKQGDYLGIGSGAVSCVAGRRWRTTRKLTLYLEGHFDREDEETLTPLNALKEKWMLGLRLNEGVEAPSDNKNMVSVLAKWRSIGALAVSPERIALTSFGRLWYNSIVADIFSALE